MGYLGILPPFTGGSGFYFTFSRSNFLSQILI